MSDGDTRRFSFVRSNRRDELRHVRDRARQTGGLALVTGLLTGAAVAGFDRLVAADMFGALTRAPLWVQAIAPGAALIVAVVAMRTLAPGGSPGLADEYIKAFHKRGRHLDPRMMPGTLDIGAVLGSWLQNRFAALSLPVTKNLRVTEVRGGRRPT